MQAAGFCRSLLLPAASSALLKATHISQQQKKQKEKDLVVGTQDAGEKVFANLACEPVKFPQVDPGLNGACPHLVGGG